MTVAERDLYTCLAVFTLKPLYSKSRVHRRRRVEVAAIVVLVALGAVLLLAPGAAAQEPDSAAVVKELFEAVNQGDVDAALGLFADRAEVTQVPALPGEFGVYAGKRQLRGWLERLVEHQVKINLAQEPTVSGDTVTGLVDQTTIFNEFMKIVNIEVLYGLFAGIIEMQARVGDGRVNALSFSIADARYSYGGVILTPSRLEDLHLELRSASGTVTFRDSDPDDFGDKLSDVAVITLEGVPSLPKAYGVAYELRFTSDDGDREAATTKVLHNADGSAEATFYLGGEVRSLTGPINELNGSGQSGRYSMTASGDQTLVLIEVTPAPDADNEPQPIHIHFGQCGEGLGPHAFVRDITRLPAGLATGVEGGRLEAVQDVDLADLVDGNHSVNMHRSYPHMSRYVACGDIPISDPTGENLLAAFSSVELILGPGLLPVPSPTLSDMIPSDSVGHMRSLLFSAPGNPPYERGVHQGLPKGSAVGLREQTAQAAGLAGEAASAGDMATLRRATEAVVNAVDGANYGDLDEDGEVEAGGDGLGILQYAGDTASYALLAAVGAPEDGALAINSGVVVDRAGAAGALALEARDLALRALGAADAQSGRRLAEEAGVALAGALDASVEAYLAAQGMATLTLAPVAPATAVGLPDAPDTGDVDFTSIGFAAVTLGAIMLLMGRALVWTARRRTCVPQWRP